MNANKLPVNTSEKIKLQNDPITKIKDFYSSSSFRVLFLHVQEHTFSCLEL